MIFGAMLSACSIIKTERTLTCTALIIRMVDRSPVSPVLGWADSRGLGKARSYSEKELCISHIDCYEIESDRIRTIVDLIVSEKSKGRSGDIPYFVIHVFNEKSKEISYSFNRDTLLRIIPLIQPDMREALQLMYDRK